ncbi:MAG TPA: rubredoxin [Candidatus Ozemobacteraceae bacterium]
MKDYECSRCGYVYRPATGDRVHHVPPFTVFADILDSWECPVCHAPKHCFRACPGDDVTYLSRSSEHLKNVS